MADASTHRQSSSSRSAEGESMSLHRRPGGNNNKSKCLVSMMVFDLFLNGTPLILSAIGIVFTSHGKFRGESSMMVACFGFVIGLCLFEILTGIIIGLVSYLRQTSLTQNSAKLNAFSIASVVTVVVASFGSIVVLVLFGVAKLKSGAFPRSDEAGCLAGYGCANIMSDIVLAWYVVRTVAACIIGCIAFLASAKFRISPLSLL